MKQFQNWAKSQSEYPHLIYDQSVVKFITEVLHKDIALSDKRSHSNNWHRGEEI